MAPIYKRIILKITGEAFRNRGESRSYNQHAVERIANEIISAHNLGTEIGIVVGAGNIVRGREIKNIDEIDADEMGMAATLPNAFYLRGVLEKHGCETRVQTAFEIKSFAEIYIRRKSLRYLNEKKIIILAGGTGNPKCSTDFAAVLRAIELQAEAILKGTKVDGIYAEYPPSKTDKPIPEISYKELMKLEFAEILDNQAIGLTIDSRTKVPIHVFNIFTRGNLVALLSGEKIGSKIVP